MMISFLSPMLRSNAMNSPDGDHTGFESLWPGLTSVSSRTHRGSTTFDTSVSGSLSTVTRLGGSFAGAGSSSVTRASPSSSADSSPISGAVFSPGSSISVAPPDSPCSGSSTSATFSAAVSWSTTDDCSSAARLTPAMIPATITVQAHLRNFTPPTSTAH